MRRRLPRGVHRAGSGASGGRADAAGQAAAVAGAGARVSERWARRFATACALWLLLALPVLAQPVAATHPPGAAVASGHALATEAGMQILREGGNAFDAAVAVSSTLSVVEPISSGMGGGGFFLLHGAKSG